MIISDNINTARYQSDMRQTLEPIVRKENHKASGSTEDQKGLRLLRSTSEAAPDKPEKSSGTEMTTQTLQDLEKIFEDIQHSSLEFSVHKKTGRTVVKVMDTKTGEIIKQIPYQELLDLAAKLKEMTGILFDKKI